MGDRSRQVTERASSVIDRHEACAGFPIRPAARADVPAIAALEKVAFTDAWSAAEFAILVHSGTTIFLVALEPEGGAVAGYVIVSAVLDEAEVLNLAVSPAWRGSGLGGRLLDAGLAEAAGAGAISVFLEVRESNVAARALYGSRGFREISRRRQYYRKPVEDALVLRGAAQR